MKNPLKGLDKEQKPLVLLSFLLAMMVLFLMPFLLSSGSSADLGTVASGYSSAENITAVEWGGNTKVMQRVADQMGLSYRDSTEKELSRTLSKVDTVKLAQIKELNLSGLGMTELPIALDYCTGLEKLDISNNQLTSLPDALLQQDGIEITADFNILPESYGYSNQYHLYLLNVEQENYNQMSLTDIYEESYLTDIAKNSLWFEVALASGGVSVTEPDDIYQFKIVTDSMKDEQGHSLDYYVDKSTGTIFREGVLNGQFYLTNGDNSLSGPQFPFTITFRLSDPSFAEASVWTGKNAFVKDLLAQTGAPSIEELPNRQLSTMTSLTLSPEGLKQLPDVLAQFPQVTEVVFHQNTDVSILNELPQITTISITDAGLTELPTGLLENQTLAVLNLSGNPLPVTVLEQLNTMQITGLRLERCGLLDIPETVVFPASLMSLSLKNNQLTSFPKTLLTQLFTTIDVSFNQISKLSGEAQALVQNGVLRVEGNLLDTRFTNQRKLVFKDGTTPNFTVRGILEPMKLLSNPELVVLSDGTPTSEALTLVFRQRDGSALPGSEYFSEGGIVLLDGTYEANLQVSGSENNENAILPIVMTLETTSRDLTKYEQELKDQISSLPESSQSVVTEMMGSTVEEVSYTVQEPDTVNALVFKALKNSGKTFSYSVNEPEGLNYQWMFKADQIRESTALDPKIEVGSTYDEEIRALSGGTTVLTSLTFENHGELPGNAVITITLPENDQRSKEATQYLYHYDEESEKITYEGQVYVSGNTISFAINHTSVYVVSPEIISGASMNPTKVKTSAARSEQAALFLSIILLLLVGIFGIGRSISLMGPTTMRPNDRDFEAYLYSKKEQVDTDSPVVEAKEAKKAESVSGETIPKNLLLQNEMYTLPKYTSSSTTASFMNADVLEQIQDVGIDFSKYFAGSENLTTTESVKDSTSHSDQTMQL